MPRNEIYFFANNISFNVYQSPQSQPTQTLLTKCIRQQLFSTLDCGHHQDTIQQHEHMQKIKLSFGILPLLY
jgi:hypothetical protein